MKNNPLAAFFLIAVCAIFSLFPLKMGFAESVLVNKTGSIKICRVIVNDKDVVVSDGTSLPEGKFVLYLSYMEGMSSEVSSLDPLVFDSSEFSANEKVIQDDSGNDMECVERTSLPFGFYYYGVEEVSGLGWNQTKYNDQYETLVSSVINFYDFDRKNNVDADGVIDLGISRPERVLMLLSRYSPHGGGEASTTSSISFGGGIGGRHHVFESVAPEGSFERGKNDDLLVSDVAASHDVSFVSRDIQNFPTSKFQKKDPSPILNLENSKNKLLAFAYGALWSIPTGFWLGFLLFILLLAVLFVLKRVYVSQSQDDSENGSERRT